MNGLDPKQGINLAKVSVLIVEGDRMAADVLWQIFSGFGVVDLTRAASGAEARRILAWKEIHLVVCGDVLPDMTGYEFVRWLRATRKQPNACTPLILTSGHTRRDLVGQARDTGANFVVAKPLSPKVLLDRVMFVARATRPFLESGDYLGPDRRFRNAGPPHAGGRRRGDPSAA